MPHMLAELKQNEVGKPLKFRTVEELEKKIDEYFRIRKKENLPITVTSLAVHLDTSRRVLCEYENRPDEYGNIIKRAKNKCEAYLEEKALENRINPTMAIFTLKNNYGWKDQIQTDITTQGRPVPILYAIHSNNSIKENPQIKEADTSDTGGNLGEQNYINPPNTDR